jgi:PAS domain S-box-containing protein
MTSPWLTAPFAEQLLASASDGIVAFDRELRYLFWNAVMEQIFGLKAADVVGHKAMDLFPFLSEIGEDQHMALALAGQESRSRDRPFLVRATGHTGTFEATYRPLRGDTVAGAGAIVGGIGVIRDVTERKRVEEHLQETQMRFRNMADASPVLLWMSGTDGLCTFFNQTWLRFTGRTLEQEWGVGWAEGVHFEDFQRCMDHYLAAFGERRVFEMEYRLRRADGEFRWILDRGTPRYTPDGTFAGYIGSCVDITERKAAEAELRRAVQVRDEFLSIASHELKTPLTSTQLQVDGLARLLRGDAEGNLDRGRLTRAVSAVTAQIIRLTELVNVLLDVSRIASGRLELDPADLDINEVGRQVIDRWRPAAGAARCDLVLRPAPGGALRGRWDPLRLEQVFNNLLSNAIKYGPGHPVEVAVEGDLRRARFSVKDHGIGIAATDHARIFERFERAVSGRNYGGLGLGLWICRQIVEAMSGTIRLESAPGEGATFVVELPRA